MVTKRKQSPDKEKGKTGKANGKDLERTGTNLKEWVRLQVQWSRHSKDSCLKVDIYVIDSGWDSLPHRVLRESIDMMKRYLESHNLFILTHEQSSAFLERHPQYVGKDPLLVTVSPRDKKQKHPAGFGTALVLGQGKWTQGFPTTARINRDQVQVMIKTYLRIINNYKGAHSLARGFRELSHKEEKQGSLYIVMHSLGQWAKMLVEMTILR